MTPFLIIRQARQSYPVFVGRNLLDQIGQLVPARGRVFVLTSHDLAQQFGERVAGSFAPVARMIRFDEGENRKTLATAETLVGELLDQGAMRDSLAVVVGGGMVGDTAGFAASIFLRGIDLVHVPTTLLAQVDSSIGGKLAVNHARGKNLIGSFYPPRAVVADLALLDTLPVRELRSGLYEALKGGVIADPSLFELFENEKPDLEPVVRKAICVKAEIVSADERETDLRRLLNYGHTIAHGIEAATNYEGMTHGDAVAWGMIGANAIAVRRGLLNTEIAAQITQTILRLQPDVLPDLDRDLILRATEHDKKNTSGQRVMVLPREIGRCAIVTDIREEEVAFGIDAAYAAQ